MVPRAFGHWCVLVLAILAIPAASQNVTSIAGAIYDPSGAGIPNAKVALLNEATGSSRTAVSDSQGSYTFPELPPGSYTLRVQVQGFKTAEHPRVQALVATPVHLDITLQVGATTEIVAVEAAAPTVNTQDASVGLAYSESEIKQLPFAARNPIDLLTLEPGVVFSGRSDTDALFQGSTRNLDPREGAVNGVRGDQSNVTLDGVDVNDFQGQATFTSGLPVSLDSIQEFRVTTTNAGATEGGAGGAQVAIVTKSGSNTFHGNARWFNRDTALAANSYFNNQVRVPRPALIRNIGGASLGGPVLKNKVLFFLDWENRQDRSQQNVTRIVPSEAMKQGILTYEVNQTTPGFDPTAPGLFPCSSGRICRQLQPADIASLDPGCTSSVSTGCGVNPAMLAFLKQFPQGNDPTQGLDSGLNFIGDRFNAPIKTSNNIYAARVDFNLSQRHTIFFRGNLAGIHTDILPEEFPGQPAAGTLLNNSKGFAVNYTGQFGNALVENFRWGFTRVGISQSGGTGTSFTADSYSPLVNWSRPFGRQVPTNEFKNDLTWAKFRTHTLQAGVDFRLPRDQYLSYSGAFPSYNFGNGFCVDNCRQPEVALDNSGNPNVVVASSQPFDRAFLELTGLIPEVSADFHVNPKDSTFYPVGTPSRRHFAENDVEWYFQDNWKMRSNLNVTLGLRWSYYGPVWEQNGLQTAPTTDVLAWFDQRMKDMLKGIPSNLSPLLQFQLAGKANGRDSWYSPDWNNFAPRIALAYSPGFTEGMLGKIFGGSGKTSIRVGAGIFYDRVGGPLAFDEATSGDPGLIDSFGTSVGKWGYANGPRFRGTCNSTGCSGFPPLSLYFTPPTSATFPFTTDTSSGAFGVLVAQHLRTPYSTNLSLTIQRELPKSVTLEVGYVGVLGQKLPAKIDTAQLYGLFYDSASNQNMWGAENQIVRLIGSNPFSPATKVANVPKIPFIENVMPKLANNYASQCDSTLTTSTATQGFYCLATQFAPDWGSLLQFMDVTLPSQGTSPFNNQLDPQGIGRVLDPLQYASSPTWTNFGRSNYHSLQLSVRKKMGSSEFGFNYVFSKSIDNGSASPNGDAFLSDTNGQLPDAFSPNASRALSDFNLKHNFNASWVVALPFGRGKAFGNKVSGKLDQVIGSWQVMGALRWHSGFPLSPREGTFYPTNFYQPGPGTVVGPLKSSVTKSDVPDGLPNLFKDPAAARALVAFTAPGSVGSRNVINGPAFFRIDLSLAKTFHLWESHTLEFRVEAFNTFNNVNFSDVASQYDTVFGGGTAPIDGFDVSDVATFGRLFSTAGPRGGAREIQTAVRYTF